MMSWVETVENTFERITVKEYEKKLFKITIFYLNPARTLKISGLKSRVLKLPRLTSKWRWKKNGLILTKCEWEGSKVHLDKRHKKSPSFSPGMKAPPTYTTQCKFKWFFCPVLH